MTDKPNPTEGPSALWADISEALATIRNALTETSLCLRDYQFEHDPIQREHASVIARALSEKIALQAQQTWRK
jgi:hypothetical protein